MKRYNPGDVLLLTPFEPNSTFTATVVQPVHIVPNALECRYTLRESKSGNRREFTGAELRRLAARVVP